MPKPARFTLAFSEESKQYELYEHDRFLLQAHGASWLTWLSTHPSFAFCGKNGRFNLLKEARKQNGEGYWYAYQRQGKRITKRYVGKSLEVVPDRLEEIGNAFQEISLPSPLLISKFQIPHVSARLLRRERLLTLLDAGKQRSLTLLAAPAGSGKTTLVAQWIATHKEEERSLFPPIAWVSLDKNDNDLVRFWRYVLTACNVFQTNCGQTALRQLATLSSFPPEMTLLEATLAHFLNALARSACEGLLILDDYQVIISSHIHQTLTFFLTHLPPSIHLMLITRTLPAFPLAQLRARGALSEIAAHDLRFSQEETLAFFQHSFPSLSLAKAIEQIDARLEGWAAGLHLFALSLQRSSTEETIRQHLAGFVSEHRPLHDYFIEEVLDTQTVSQQQFLLCTSLLNRLTASLCDAVMERQDSATVLRSLERAGLFVERLDGPGQWYRYHALFAEAMRAETRWRLDEETIRAIFLRAGRWYEQEGLLTEAIEQALQTQEPVYAAAMIERYLTRIGFDEMQEFSTLRRWLEQLPTNILSLYPLLCLHKAQVLSLSFAPEPPPSNLLAQMDELLQMAEARWHAEDNTARLGEVYAFRAYLATRQRAQEQAYTYASQALHWLPIASQHWRGVCLNLLGAGELSWGQLSRAQTLLQEALTIWTNLHHVHGARSCMLLLATLYFEQGALRLAAACYERVAQEAREVGDREDLIPALIGLAQLSYEWNDLEAAEQAAQEAWDASERMGSPELLMRSAFVLIKIQFQYSAGRLIMPQGQKMLVEQRIASLLMQCAARADLSTEVQLCQLHYWLAEGDVTTVQHRLTMLTIPEGNTYTHIRKHKKLLEIRVLLEQKKYRQAFEELERLREAALQEGRGRMLLQIQLLLARLHLTEKHIQEAHQTLNAALLFTHTEGYLRSFLDEGREIAELLRMMQSRGAEPPILNSIQTILSSFGPTPRRATAALAPLSQQEQRVLHLIVAELSYPEIARELTISLNTVKTHVNTVYRKLNVHSRREARAVAQDLHLFASER
ncbi:MAG TPA: LuxR C-terminal-related transcriptional regulator [Ktedonobacteraceae bacterium]|nr:LuxR C-terminal-related transcriptional regulator [Ktedonobacteraceae bacterium]